MNADELEFPDTPDPKPLVLTKREYIAAMAMHGMARNIIEATDLRFHEEWFEPDRIVKIAVMLADALIAEVEKGKEK